MPNCCCRQIYLFVVYVCKGNAYIVSRKHFPIKKVIYRLLFNVFIQNTYVSLHLYTNSILLYIIIYNAVFLIPVVVSSLVPVVLSSRVPVVLSSLDPVVSSFRVPGVLSSRVPVVLSSLDPVVSSFRVPVMLSSLVPVVVSSLVPFVLSSLVPVVISFRVPRRHICSHQPCGDASREYRAAGSLASELKVSGLFSKCDCSKYQLFGGPS